MLLIRAAEFAFVELSKLGKIRGPLHTSVGQEAVAVSVCCNLKKDSIFSNHRGHGHYLAKWQLIQTYIGAFGTTQRLLWRHGWLNACC